MAAYVSESLLVADPHHGQSGQPDTNGAAGPPQAGGTGPAPAGSNIDRVINHLKHVTTR